MNETPESKLVEKVLNGDVRAFRDIVNLLQPMVYSVSYRFLQNIHDAEDAVQEAFVRLWKNLHKFDGRAKLSTWLYRITVHLCLDKLKTKRTINEDLSATLPDHSPSVIEQLENREQIAMIHNAAGQLPERQQAVFILRDLEGLSVEETRAILDMTESQLKSNLYHARKRIREIIQIKKYGL